MKRRRLIFIISLWSIVLLISGFVIWIISFTDIPLDVFPVRYIPSIKGKVIDAETKAPIKGVNVRAAWVTAYLNPGGSGSRTFKVYLTKTDQNGEFILPRFIKFKIPIIEVYQGVDMLIYEHRYVCQNIERRSWREGGRIKYYHINLKLIKNDEEFSKNLDKLSGEFFYWKKNKTYKSYDVQFILDDFKIFFEEYPNSPLIEEEYRNLGNFYEIELKDYKLALKIYEDFMQKFPNSSKLNWVKDDIRTLKRLIQSLSNKQIYYFPITLLEPSGNEIIPSGSTYTLQWMTEEEVVKFDLLYSIDNGLTWQTIANNVTSKSYDWTVPIFKNKKDKCRVKVIGYNASDTKVYEDKSAQTFTIDVVKVTSPIK